MTLFSKHIPKDDGVTLEVEILEAELLNPLNDLRIFSSWER
jgi:hypothetical protein